MEKVVDLRKEEEENLINKAVRINQGQQTISSLGTGGPEVVTTAQEYSLDELEQMRDSLKLKLQMHANELKFLVNGRQDLSTDLVDTVCEAYFAEHKTWFAALIQEVDLKSDTV